MADTVTRFRANDALNATRDVGLRRGGYVNVIETNTEQPNGLRGDVLAPGGSNWLPADEGVVEFDTGDLVRMFEESEDASNTARQHAERDRDYVDNKQYTSDELAELRKRGQPPGMDNRIKSKIDYLVGLEKQQRIDPKALPRTPMHEEEAEGVTQALRYVAEDQDFDGKRSGVWRNMLVEGAGGISVSIEQGYDGEPCVKLQQVAWDRMFWDPHSSKPDYSDAGYLGLVLWMNYDDAALMYPDALDALNHTLSTAPSDTYDDKPKFAHWADKKRKRIRICQIWIKRGEDWFFAEFTKGGVLKSGPSPYVNDKGESECELFFQSAYVDRDNNRYGIVREMIELQDAINKRNSKSLHLLSVHQTTYEEGAIDDIEHFRKEKARPDGTMKVAPGALSQGRIVTEQKTDLATAHFQLLQEAKNAIDLKGPNATAMGDKAQGSSAASGRAIIASQQGGMITLGDLLDHLRHLDRRVFRAIWNRIRQCWTGEKWIRVTDDERNIRWLGMNVDPAQVQMLAMQNPEAAQKIAGAVGNVAQLDVDIIIDEVPDVIASQEQFGMLVELKKMDANNEIPFRALVAASSIKDKAKMLEEMDKAKQPPPMAEEQMQLQMRGAMAEVAEREASAGLKQAQAQKTIVEAQIAPIEAQANMQPDAAPMMQPQEYEPPPALQDDKMRAEIEALIAKAQQAYAAAYKTNREADLAPARMAQEAQFKRQQLQQRPRVASPR